MKTAIQQRFLPTNHANDPLQLIKKVCATLPLSAAPYFILIPTKRSMMSFHNRPLCMVWNKFCIYLNNAV